MLLGLIVFVLGKKALNGGAGEAPAAADKRNKEWRCTASASPPSR
jgi:hypothetical protein